jgi:hypothetical protein
MPTGGQAMDEKVLRARLAELHELLSALPKTDSGSSSGTYIAHPQAGAKTVEELLDHLRLQVKYLMFDLEATRRENRYLRQMLERRSSFGEGPDAT